MIVSGSLRPVGHALRRLRAPLAWPWSLRIGLLLLGILVAVAVAAPVFGSPTHQDFTNGLTSDGFPLGPGGYPLGTDELGRNMLARLAFGARTSLTVALVSTVTSLVLAVTVGVFAGFYRGALETILMRLTDVALAVPFVLAALVLAAVIPPGLARVIVIITALFWAYPARLIYGEVVRLRRRGFIEASDAAGSTGIGTIRRHVIPHVLPLVVSYMPLNAASAIGFESALSYLGAGINPPTPSWGNMISDGQSTIAYSPHLLVEPSLMLGLAVLTFLLIGEGIKAVDAAVTRTSWLDV